MSKLMTDEVDSVFNWRGKGKKHAFRDFEIQTVVVGCVNSFFGKKQGNKSFIENAIKEWLKGAPYKLRGNNGRRSINNVDTSEAEVDI